MPDQRVASFSDDHQPHMQKYLHALLLGNLKDYVRQARAVSGDGPEVYRTMLNLSLAANAYWDHAVKGKDKAAGRLRRKYDVVINAELTNGYRHYLTDKGRYITDHTPKRIRDIVASETGGTRAIYRPQIQLEGETLDYNTMINSTIGKIIKHASENKWIDDDTRNAISTLLNELIMA